MSYKIGDKVVVTDPVSPNGHQVGECVTVTAVSSSGKLLRATDEQGREAPVWSHEIRPA
ncbi:hypothetical protein [Kitasatospora sp. NPDC127116]|uniref:hypothetical protein n=1 Tax=Kitasatospora sp. NPDC127116 TaxID=3345367 RepID=UPI00363FEE34